MDAQQAQMLKKSQETLLEHVRQTRDPRVITDNLGSLRLLAHLSKPEQDNTLVMLQGILGDQLDLAALKRALDQVERHW